MVWDDEFSELNEISNTIKNSMLWQVIQYHIFRGIRQLDYLLKVKMIIYWNFLLLFLYCCCGGGDPGMWLGYWRRIAVVLVVVWSLASETAMPSVLNCFQMFLLRWGLRVVLRCLLLTAKGWLHGVKVWKYDVVYESYYSFTVYKGANKLEVCLGHGVWDRKAVNQLISSSHCNWPPCWLGDLIIAFWIQCNTLIIAVWWDCSPGNCWQCCCNVI